MRSPRRTANALVFIPSFYGAVAWGAWLGLYAMKLIRLDPCGVEAMAIFLLVEVAFILATVTALPLYRPVVDAVQEAGRDRAMSRAGKTALLAAHLIGLLGLAKYVVDFSRNLGGIYGFLFALATEAETIRMEAETSSSIGTQLSYIGWLAVALTVYHLRRKAISRWWWLAVFVQCVGNLTFIDRTRPVTILFTSLLMVLPPARNVTGRRVVASVASFTIIAVALFSIIAVWSGKTFYKGLDQSPYLPGITQDMYMYGVSGFAYFNRMLLHKEEISYAPVRLFYPAYKFAASHGLAAEPPSPILEFYEVPFTTNVGTFLEPLYRDGGILFVILGTLLYSFGLNLLSLPFLRSRNPVAYYAWATLCFTAFISFFVPKLSFFGTWVFLALGVAALTARGCSAVVLKTKEAGARP